MRFLHPEVLYAFFALLIPILVHLFQLRKFQTEQFTNVVLLKKLEISSRKSSQLKKWLTLLIRLLTISCLIGLYQDDVVQFEKDGENEISDVDIECKAVECSPPPTFRWMIGDRQQSHSMI